MDERIKEYIKKYEIIWGNDEKILLLNLFDQCKTDTNQENDMIKSDRLLIVKHSEYQIDEWSIYSLSDSDDEYELIGNFRKYMTYLLCEYRKIYMNLQLVRRAQTDLQEFSKRCASALLWIHSEKIDIGSS